MVWKFKAVIVLGILVLLSGCSGRSVHGLHVEDFYEDLQYQDLLAASATGDIKKIDQLVKRGLDVNKVGKQGMVPLFWALAAENIQGVESLLKHGANPNFHSPHRDISPVSLAVILPNPKAIELVLAYGGDPNTIERNKTVLSIALRAKRRANAQYLLEHGADINFTVPPSHRNALRDSIALWHFDNTLFLLEQGADYSFDFLKTKNYVIQSLKECEPRINKKSQVYLDYLKVVEFLRERGEDI